MAIISLLLFSQLIKAEFCQTPPSPHDFSKKEKILDNFIFDKTIKDNSEQMLSRLILAKSPMITNWIKNRNLNPEKEAEKIAIEWDKYYGINFILAKFPSDNSIINQKITNTIDTIIKEYYTKAAHEKFEQSFTEIKTKSIAIIESYPVEKKIKELLIEKINKIKLFWPIQLAHSKIEKAPLEFIDWSLAFDPKNNEINVGLNAFNYNDESLKAAFAHEIAHVFDSCRWSQFETIEWPFNKIGNCLREFAQKRDDKVLETLYKNGKIDIATYTFVKSNPTCNNSIYPPIGVQGDQLPETFADWFASEVMSKENITTSFRNDLCNNLPLNPGSTYLSNKDRLEKIYGSNPNIASIFKVKSIIKHCSF